MTQRGGHFHIYIDGREVAHAQVNRYGKIVGRPAPPVRPLTMRRRLARRFRRAARWLDR